MQGVQVQLVMGELRTELGMLIQENGVALDEEQLLFIAGGQDNAIDKDVDEQPVQDLALTVDNVFQADDCDAFDSDVDEAPTTQTMFMANLSSADLFMMKPDAICEHHEVHEMHDDVQPTYAVASHADYMSDSNMIPYDQYVKDNAVPVIQIDNSLTAELATYKEQVELYERRARFELMKREQKINEQLRIVITDRNIKEENLKKELHSVKMQLASTINHNKSMVEEVTSLKKDFKQKENKYLEEFLDMKALKEKVEDKLYKQDQSLQTVYMLCKLKSFYHEQNKGIQKALTKEIKEMKDIFEELEAKVDQNSIIRKHDEIERKNILIANDNLIAECLSKEVFYIETNSELNVSRLTEMHDAHTVVQACFLALEVELSKLRDKLKYQNLKESYGNNTSQNTRDAPDFDSVFIIEKMKASIQGKDNAIKKLRMQISQLKETHSETDRTLNFRALDFQITQLTKKVNALQEQNELYRAENEKIKKHYKELYDSIKITHVTADHVKPTILAPGKYAINVESIPPCNRNNREVHLAYLKHLKESVETLRKVVEEAKELLEYAIGTCLKDFNRRDKKHALIPLIRKKQVTFENQCDTSNSNTHKHVEQMNTQKTNVHVPPSTRVNNCTDASRSQPRSNTKKNRILPTKSVNMKKVETHPRTIKSSLKTMNHVDSSISSKRTVVQIVLWYLDSGCSKHMTGDRSRLRNFMKKFIGTFRFENDHFGAIMGYGDYVIGDSMISRKALLLCLRYGCIYHQKTVPRTPQQNGIVERRNRTLVEAARKMLIFSKAPMFLWTEVVATACYIQNRSLIHTRHNKTPYELVHDKKHDLTFFRVFGALFYPTNDSEDLGKLQPTTDIRIFVGYAPSRK
ncbi:retrovirus-related pol polyprotein from transposon TNT 1-94, partial [Tanacetum coccineum]